MTLAHSSQSQLSYVKESTFNATPGGPTMLTMRHISHNLALIKEALMSEERRSDGQRVFVRHGMKSVQAAIEAEASYLAHKDWIRAALRYPTTSGSFTSTAGTDTAFSSSTKKITRTSGSWVTDGALVNMKIRVTGSTSNDGVYTLTAVSALEATVSEALSDEAATADVKINGEYAENGTTETSFSVEAGFTDITQYEVFTGVRVASLALNAEPSGLIGVTFNVMGAGHSISGSSLGALTDVDTSEPLDTYSAGAAKIKEGGSAIALISQFQMTHDLGRAGRPVLGTDEYADIAPGMHNLSGSCRAYFQDATLLNKFLNETASSLEMGFQDPAGNELNIQIPAIKYTTGNKSVGNDDIPLELNWTAYRDTTTGLSIMVNMIPATAT